MVEEGAGRGAAAVTSFSRIVALEHVPFMISGGACAAAAVLPAPLPAPLPVAAPVAGANWSTSESTDRSYSPSAMIPYGSSVWYPTIRKRRKLPLLVSPLVLLLRFCGETLQSPRHSSLAAFPSLDLYLCSGG